MTHLFQIELHYFTAGNISKRLYDFFNVLEGLEDIHPEIKGIVEGNYKKKFNIVKLPILCELWKQQ
jgi:hypothetical protein